MKTIISLSQSQISEFLRCAQLWNLHSAQLWGKAEVQERHALDAGTIVHAFLEQHYKGNNFAAAPRHFSPETKELWEGFDEREYKGRPKYLTRDFLFERVKMYIMGRTLQGDWKAKDVEVGFSTVIFENDQFVFVLEGRIDLLTEGMIIDFKTQSRYSNLSKRKIQFITYAMATGIPHVMIQYIMLTEKVDNHTFRTDLMSYSRAEMEYWKNYLIERVFMKIAKWEIEPNHGACAGTYDAAPCMFENVCWETDEDMRSRILRQNFVQIEEHRSW